MAYVYKSEGGQKQTIWVATCPSHGRDLSIHKSRHVVQRIADNHSRLHHG